MAALIAWQNGVLTDSPHIDAAAPGFLHGYSVFETFRTYAGRLLAFDWHWARLSAGADRLGLSGRWAEREVRGGLAALMGAWPEARIRITLYRGPHGRDGVEALITAQPLPPLAKARYAQGYRAGVAPWEQRIPPPLVGLKAGAYLGWALAREWAIGRGWDEALLHAGGYLLEATAANLFVVHGGRVLTPPVAQPLLPGTVRRWLLQAQWGQEAPVPVRALARESAPGLAADTATAASPAKTATAASATQMFTEAIGAEAIAAEASAGIEEAFLTNAVLGIMPLTQIDGRPIGTGSAGPRTRAIAAAWRRHVQAECGAEAGASVWDGEG